MGVLVIVPTYNERDNLPPLVEAVLALDPIYNVLVVDDGSPDGTGEVAEALAARVPGRLEVLHRTGPRGLGRSYLDGIARALQGPMELVCQMDADFSHDPRYLPEMVARAAAADLVIGSRYVQGVSVVNWPLRRIMLSSFANGYVRAVTRLSVRDCTSGFRCWRRDALAAVTAGRIASDGYAFQFEMLYEAVRLGFRVVEVPIIFVERRQGVSKMSTGVVTEAALAPWRLVLRRRRAP
jgi:dolichol-phosphate mannosyltransferase